MTKRHLVAGASAALALILMHGGWAVAETSPCQIEGRWSATYTLPEGEVSGPVVFTVEGDTFLGKAVLDEATGESAETIRGRISAGAIQEVAVLHSHKGWVPGEPSTDDDCAVITIDLPNAIVTLERP